MRVPGTIAKRPPADAPALEAVAAALHRPLPEVVRALYQTTNGLTSEERLVLYGCEDIVERNETFEVARYAADWIAIGDDSGGRVLLVSDGDRALWVDVGSMDPRRGTPLGQSVQAWIEAGTPLEASTPTFPATVDIYLESVPKDGLRGLIRVKHGLDLELRPVELEALLAKVPVRLQRGVPYGQALKRCRTLNAVDDCVGLRAVDDPSRKLSLAGGNARVDE